MARINVDDELRGDPRFHVLCSLLPRNTAYGSLICLWELGQSYWKKDRSLIPKNIFDLTPNATELVTVGFVKIEEGGVYCIGAKERWNFLLAPSENGKKGGMASAEKRRLKYGTAIPVGATNSEANLRSEPKQTSEANRSKPKPSSSSSSSSSSSNKTATTAVAMVGWTKLQNAWNENCGELNKILTISPKRAAFMKERWAEKPDEAYWIDIVRRIAASRFCNGANDTDFMASFDFLIKPDVHLKTLEGAYDNRDKQKLKPKFGFDEHGNRVML